ncbi:MAG: ketoacyl-ACP synthase III [Flavobacteriales bacterium]|nr:ketoacyl-ACP synthase III [Flavobacteriales bacterium]
MKRTTIIGSGSFVPEQILSNSDFHSRLFYTADSELIETPLEEITRKFQQITGIRNRRWADDNMVTSDLAFFAAERAIKDSGIDPETLDQIIVAHNFGDVKTSTIQSEAVPSLASRVKNKLGIKNPNSVAYDILFGCPGWVQGVIQTEAFFKAGMAKRALVVGSETLSRVIDTYDRDSMLFSDGAGATVLEYKDSEHDSGILSTAAATFAEEEVEYLFMEKSYKPDSDERVRFMKMKGRKVYEFALKYVPAAMKLCLDKAKVDISDVKKIFIHQANEKLDEAVISRLYRLYGRRDYDNEVLPMSVHEWGNSSVATVPTLYDVVNRGRKKGHKMESGDILLFASVGAGMNINAFCYRY